MRTSQKAKNMKKEKRNKKNTSNDIFVEKRLMIVLQHQQELKTYVGFLCIFQ